MTHHYTPTLTLIDTFDEFRQYSAIAEYVSRTRPTLSVPTAENAYFYALRDEHGNLIGGYGLKSTGGDDVTLIGLFSTSKGYGNFMIQHAIARGANRLECFDGPLERIYDKHGFRVATRYEFDPALAPESWDTDIHGTPDYLVMLRD